MNTLVIDTAFGHVKIKSDGSSITHLDLTNEALTPPSNDPLLETCAKEITRYFNGEKVNFSVPLKPIGTPFQQCVWDALTRIPYGETRSYQDIAIAIGNQDAVRAVGGAVNKNPIMIIIPCHRVIGKDGSLVGFYGGLELKTRLLNLEGHHYGL
ncbi:methylated-DNA--[protein]-cysteine S-methyltransferase [Paracholeplasma vituli]|uniref:methylated-DNA--[protein]-cysteine S-methyltransferase n=1 Tax=Paracholeplasma vituli TaxID=69473 RepID=UPI00272ED799|nr:methylated-DNA--[protein]-cysteine S-methyltransferase [Paracholeplasma vituli]